MDPTEELDAAGIPPLTLPGSIWAIQPEVLPRLIEAHRSAATPAWGRLATRMAAKAPKTARRSAGQRAGGAVAIVPLTGVLTPRGSFLSYVFGGMYGGLQEFRESFRDAVSSPDIGAIVLDVDSPGGLHAMTPETAAEVFEARGEKPIVAVANTLAASGAYWIASQADEIVVTPSGDVGSIGTYMVHEDWSGWNDQQGIIPTYISAGKYKIEGNPDEPLSDDAQMAWQEEADEIYAEFLDAVAAGRDVSAETVRDQYGEGRCLRAPAALAAGMVDRIDTLETVISDLLVPASNGRASTRAVARPTAPRTSEPGASDDTDPTHVPDEAPEVEPPPDPVEPDTGPDAEPAPPEHDGDAPDNSPEARAAIAALLI